MLVNITSSQLKYLHFLEKHHIKEEQRFFITQNQAHKRFGRANVERWLKTGRVRCFQRPNVIEYRMHELLEAAENDVDCEFHK